MLTHDLPAIAFPADIYMLQFKAGERTLIELADRPDRNRAITLFELTPDTALDIDNFDSLLREYVTTSAWFLYVDGSLKSTVLPCRYQLLHAEQWVTSHFLSLRPPRVRTHLYAFEHLYFYLPKGATYSIRLTSYDVLGGQLRTQDYALPSAAPNNMIMGYHIFVDDRLGIKYSEGYFSIRAVVTIKPASGTNYQLTQEFVSEGMRGEVGDIFYTNGFGVPERLDIAQLTHQHHATPQLARINGRDTVVRTDSYEEFEAVSFPLTDTETFRVSDILNSRSTQLTVYALDHSLGHPHTAKHEVYPTGGDLKLTRDAYTAPRAVFQLRTVRPVPDIDWLCTGMPLL